MGPSITVHRLVTVGVITVLSARHLGLVQGVKDNVECLRRIMHLVLIQFVDSGKVGQLLAKLRGRYAEPGHDHLLGGTVGGGAGGGRGGAFIYKARIKK